MSTERQVERLDRLTNSVNGNPRYRVHFTDGSSALTQSDASFCYAITNPEFRDVPVLVEFTRSGRIAHMKPAASVASMTADACTACLRPSDCPACAQVREFYALVAPCLQASADRRVCANHDPDTALHLHICGGLVGVTS